MKKMQVTAKVPAKNDQPQLGPVTVEVDTGETAAEKIKMFGDEAVSSNSDANWTVTLQGSIRSALKRGETPEQIQARLGSAKMGVAVQKAQVDPESAYLARFQTATPEERKAMLQKLQAMAKAGA